MTDEALNARLENWGASLGGRVLVTSTATESLEGRYRSPQQWHALGALQARVDGPDHEDAQTIESAVVLLPLFHHAMLRCWYVHRLSPGTCIGRARRVGGPNSPDGNYLPTHLERAHLLLSAALELPSVIRRDRAREYVQRRLAGADAMAGLDSPESGL